MKKSKKINSIVREKLFTSRLLIVLLIAVGSSSCSTTKDTARKPNIIFIYTDDVGYGDLGCYGATGVQTPNVDFLAKNGIQYTDAHSSAATCTPSRYSILTGSYAFRNNAAILPGSAPLLINPGTPTLPGMLQKEGYQTGVIGKWHLGLGNGSPQWNGKLEPGPLEIGFNYSFIVPATLDRVPTVFVENHSVVNLTATDSLVINYQHKIGSLPTGLEHSEMLKMPADSQHSGTIIDSISRIGFMSGGKSAWWHDEDIAQVLINKVKEFIDGNKKGPFFLYFAVTDIHVPRDPNKRFLGKSSMGLRGDAIAEMDWSTGEVLKILKDAGLDDNTLIIFSSDNGPILDDGYGDNAEELLDSDKPQGPFKGGKYSAFEAGTRMPTIVYWPGTVKPAVNNALLTQVDFYSSLATLVGHKMEDNEAPDSYNMLNVLMGKSQSGRTDMLEEAFTLALRSGKWKYIAAQTKPTPDWLKNKKIATGLSPYDQLYNLETDTAENNNIIDKYPEQAEKMKLILVDIQQKKGIRPGFGKKDKNSN